MAFISSEAHITNGEGDFLKGGHGSSVLYWHNMPLAKVTNLPANDCRGDIEIQWLIGLSKGVRVCMSVDEADSLAGLLCSAITTHVFGNDNDVAAPEPVNDDGPGSEPKECW